MILHFIDKLCRLVDATLIFENTAGIKCFNQQISSGLFDRFIVKDIGPVSPQDLYLFLDRLKDDVTLTGKTIVASPYCELMAALKNGHDIRKTEYMRRLSRGALDSRLPARINNALIGYMRRRFKESQAQIQSGNMPAIKVVSISGRYYIADGRHRAALCALHGLSPRCLDVTPIVRDSFFHWLYLRMKKKPDAYRRQISLLESAYREEMAERNDQECRSIADIARDLRCNPVESGGDVYHPIPFAEFSFLRTSTVASETYRKWGLIERAVFSIFPGGFKGLKVLDIGANAGFYAFSCAQQGASVMAFEPRTRYAQIGGIIAREKNLPVDWRGIKFDFSHVKDQKFHVTFMLSVFQWMAEAGDRLEEACRQLQDISRISEYLVFELGFNKGKSCLKTNNLNHYAELVRLLKANTCYKHFILLGRIKMWHSAPRYLVLCSNDPRYNDRGIMKIVSSVNL